MVTTPTRAEVATVYEGDPTSAGTSDLTDNDADALITAAVSMHDALFSDQLLFTSESVDEDEAVKYLAAHKWALTLGDEVSSESQAGANVTYHVSTATARSLSRTKYGAEYLEYLRSEGEDGVPNIGVFRT